MPSFTHESLKLLFENRPRLAGEILRDVLGVPVPMSGEARVESAQLSEVTPTEYRADLVVVFGNADQHGEPPALAVVVEVQLSRDQAKRRTWPLYVSAVHARYGCDAVLLVVSPDPAVAAWCRASIRLGHPGFELRPLVLDFSAVPALTDSNEALAAPELAVLSAVAHGEDERAVEIALAAAGACAGLDEQRARLYFDLVLGSLGRAARAAFEGMMQTGQYEYQSDFARKYFAQGFAEALLAVIQAKLGEGEVDDEVRSRVEALRDRAELTRLIAKVAAARDRAAVLAALNGGVGAKAASARSRTPKLSGRTRRK